ncbi:MAG: sigma 54-interacting transcriptional regulator [Planctomycetes bacterium]|nr:sigma 54-interacting transcriptional regulator [Planctomycetota bacterium]
MNTLRKVLLYVTTPLVILYCISVMYYVQAGWDLGLRGLFANSATVHSEALGTIIGRADDAVSAAGPAIQSGDVLYRIAGLEVPSALHLAPTLQQIAPPVNTTGVVRLESVDQLAAEPATTVLVDIANQRWARADFFSAKAGQVLTTWLLVKPNSSAAVWLSLAWFLLELGIFGIGAAVVWKRPGDISAVLFFLLCTVNAVAFMGAFHWPSLIGSKALAFPFVFCAMLLAPMTLHFFAMFPRPLGIIRANPRASTLAIYLLPGIWIVYLFYQIIRIDRLYLEPSAAALLAPMLDVMAATIYGYLAASMGMYLVGFGVLIYRFLRGRTMQERQQVQGLLGAVMLTTGPVGYLLWTALNDRAEFAFGPMPKLMVYVVSLMFTAAYGLSITRYKLLQVGRVVNRGIFYVGISSVATVIFCAMVGLATALVGEFYFQWENALAAGFTAMATVVCLGWIRDRFQKSLDRSFYREKYRLDKAVRQLGAAVERLVEPAQLARQLLQGARDTIGAERGVVYLRDDDGEAFVVADHIAWPAAPQRLPRDHALLAELTMAGTLKKAASGVGARALQSFGAELGYLLEVEGTVIGAAFFGPRDDGEAYTPEDQNFVSTLARTTTLALSTAQGHRTILSLKEELQSKVDKISEQQRRIMYLQGELLSRADGPDVRNDAPGDKPAAREGESAPLRGEILRSEILGGSAAVRDLLEKAAKVSQSTASVLVRGESGTGKELLARAIHRHSPRAEKPFVTVHCAALAGSLLESELFGHVKGAFTGADRDKVGRFELADGGTLFLDEIGDISLETQTKLLRVLQQRTFERVGGVQTIQVDVRLVAATHQNLEELIRQGRFREDLFYRLNVISLRCPSLRERPEDIFELSLHFLRGYAKQLGKAPTRIEEEALDVLTRYAWPGNIRQLENAIERAVVLAENDAIRVEDLPPEIVAAVRDVTPIALPRGRISTKREPATASRLLRSATVVETVATAPAGLADELDLLERERISEALVRAGGNKAEAARSLGIPRSTLFSKLRKYGLD